MKTYFLNKIKSLSENIENCKSTIVRYAQEGTFKNMQDCVDKMNSLEVKRSEFIKDAVQYLSVAEIIEINALKDYRGELSGKKLFTESDISYEYQFSSKGVTPNERELLVKEFGYHLKEAKVK